MRRLFMPISCLTATLLIAAGCGGSSGRTGAQRGSPEYATNGTFTIASSQDIGAFDPYGNRVILGLSVLAYDSLVNQRPDGTFVSGLAQNWTVDAEHATFTLRPEVTCSSGEKLTASQVAAALAYLADPKNSSPQYGVNVPTIPFKATGDDASGTVKIVTKKPYGFLLNTIGLAPIVCARGMKDREILKTGSDGTGPFVLSSVVAGQSYTFTARKDYRWGPGGATTKAPGTPSKIIIKVVTNETTAANLLLSGELNLAKITGDDQQRLQAQGLQRRDWSVGGAWLSFNHRGRPGADKRVRQALVAGLDVASIIKISTGGTGTPAKGLTVLEPRGCTGDTVAGNLPAHDPAAAQTLLDEAGWTKGSDGFRSKDGKPLTIDLRFLPTVSAYERPTAEFVSQQWKALGVRVNLSGDSKTTEALYKTGDWDVFLSGYQFSLPSQMVPYLSGTFPPNGNNIGGVVNKKYDTLTAKAVTMTPPEACSYWNEAEKSIIREVDLAPISTRTEHWFLHKATAQIQRYNAPIPTSIRVLK